MPTGNPNLIFRPDSVTPARTGHPSPSATGMYFCGKKTLGSKQVPRTFLVTERHSHNKAYLLARNAFINSIDAATNLRLAPFTQPRRIYIDRAFSPDDFQKHDPEVQAIIDGWKKDAEASIRDNNLIRLHQQWVQKFLRLKPNEPRRQELEPVLRKQIEDDFSALQREAEDELNSPSVNIKTYYLARHRTEILPNVKNELLEQLSKHDHHKGI
ncbi:MAG: hypothetical protein HY537_15195 [Deltaproteobacteria bacterium]|nr:hypothetical protein [Deltaproteobacteria bacterium]